MTENDFTNMPDDTSIVQKYLDAFRRSEYFGPEKALLVAILEDAVLEYRKYGRAHDADGKRRFQEVEEWIMRGGDGYVFSFDNVCESLGLDPEFVRRGLLWGSNTSEHREGIRRRAA